MSLLQRTVAGELHILVAIDVDVLHVQRTLPHTVGQQRRRPDCSDRLIEEKYMLLLAACELQRSRANVEFNSAQYQIFEYSALRGAIPSTRHYLV